ncbi:MAG: cytidine deaminase, partial [Egibacteraceae bacterium]
MTTALSDDERALLEVARAAREAAYAPYSGFKVGAALRAADGTVFSGANVENAAFSPTICAERVALPAAVVAGHQDFLALAMVGGGGGPRPPRRGWRPTLCEFSSDLIL